MPKCNFRFVCKPRYILKRVTGRSGRCGASCDAGDTASADAHTEDEQATTEFAFLDFREAYDCRDFERGAVSGVQAGTVRLAEALARRGHDVSIYNARPDEHVGNGVRYRPIAARNGIPPEAVAVTNNDIALLAAVPARRKAVWARLNIDLKTLRKRRYLLTALRLRPHLICPSQYTARRAEFFLPFRSRQVIEHGIDSMFLRFAPLPWPPAPLALFCSQPRRNLDLVIEAWRTRIRPRVPRAKLHIYFPRAHLRPDHLDGLEAEGIEIKGSVGKGRLAVALRSARVMIYPGHKEETFCNVAAEAIAAGLPVVTMGIGALAERVRHGIDGFVARTTSAMADHAADLLSDDVLWRDLHEAGLANVRNCGWDARAYEWEQTAERWRA